MSISSRDAGMVRRELWRSFGSVLRAYASGKQVCGRSVAVEEDGERIQLRAAHLKLRMQLDFDSGRGELRFGWYSGKAAEALELNLDGTVSVGGLARPLDLAAIEILEDFERRAGKVEEEAITVAALAAII